MKKLISKITIDLIMLGLAIAFVYTGNFDYFAAMVFGGFMLISKKLDKLDKQIKIIQN